MTNLSASIAGVDPLVAAAVVAVLGGLGARYWRQRHTRGYLLLHLAVFGLLTALMLAGGVVPYQRAAAAGAPFRRLLGGAEQFVWWCGAAWLAVHYLRAFLVLRRQPRQSKLVQDLLAALIYVAAAFAIIAYVFDLPVKGLLATSGVLAIVIGLALQSSLADVFSGIVLNIERPYYVGDWIVLDDTVQGKVIETNWRATHILTGNHDVAIFPNSIIAKSKLVNCSTPSKIHGASIRVKLEPSITPAVGRKLLMDVLMGSVNILKSPEPSVVIKDVSAETIDFELSYSVEDVSSVGPAQNELFDQIYRATSAAGARFSPRLSGGAKPAAREPEGKLGVPEHLLAGISLFSCLTSDESVALASQMKRQTYRAGETVVKNGTVMQALCVVAYGFLAGSVEEDGRMIEIVRLTPGDYFGEMGLLTGEPLNGQAVALTRVTIYEISKEALAPLLKARPRMAEELSESLAKRKLARQAVLDHHPHVDVHEEGLKDRVAASIRRIFSLRSSPATAGGGAERPG